jgi:hypothetical protein
MTLKKFSLAEFVMFALMCAYGFLFYQSISPYIFSELYTTDDAMQQTFPLWQAVYHDAFREDPITEGMKGYLPPIHWELSYIVTLCTQSPVMTAHVMTCVQLGLALCFLYLFVKQLTKSDIPAWFSIIWFLHSRNLPQRLTGGIPRGWAPFIILATLYFIAKKNQIGVLTILFIGILTNPPATFMCALCYGLYLFINVVRPETRFDTKPQFVRYLIASPILAGIALLSLQRPPEFGHMATLEEAEANPAFNAAGGRFPFVPLDSPFTQIKSVGTQAFQNKWHHLPTFFPQSYLLYTLIAVLTGIYVYSRRKKRELIPAELSVFLVSIFIVYFLSRFFAFQLYVPDRHLQYPLNIFWITAFTTVIWRLSQTTTQKKSEVRAVFNYLLLGTLLFYLGGDGLQGVANFNTKLDKFQRLYSWMRLNTDRSDVFASHPKEIDLLPLASIRKAYITEETAHPFYSGYWNLVKRRYETSFRMLYARTSPEFLDAMGDEKIDYFIFPRSRFTERSLETATSFSPFGQLVKRLVKKGEGNLMFTKILEGKYQDSIVYSDSDVIVVKTGLLPR